MGNKHAKQGNKKPVQEKDNFQNIGEEGREETFYSNGVQK
jgi:hypothetical protein